MQRKAIQSRRDDSLTPRSGGREGDNEPVVRPPVDAQPDEEDADTELLRELAREVELARSGRPAPAEPARPAVDPRLQVFLDTAPAAVARRSLHLRVPDVEIDDLVEELATTAAALRARRAA